MATYSSSGVDIKKVKGIHRAINSAIFSSAPRFVIPIAGHYAGLFRVGGSTIAIHTDGVGSKILVADALGKFDTIGIDCVAMNVNDLVCVGAKPLVLVDYLALAREDDWLVLQVMKGLLKGARQAGCAIIGGETAILPEMIKGGKRPFDLAATCAGVVESGKPITGDGISKGDVVVGLESTGIHSNGYTLARKILDMKKWGRQMLAPTRIYAAPVLEMLEKCKIHGIAHITGGAYSKLMRIGERAGRGFLLDCMPKTKGVMAELERLVGSDYEFYRTFNAGIGMCIVCPKKEAAKAIGIALRHGIRGQVIGRVIEEQDVVLQKHGKKISLL